MLPKDILKYARKFSPVEIENAIKKAIDAIGKTIQGIPTSNDWQALQWAARQQLMTPLPQPIDIMYQPTWTTTSTITNYDSRWISNTSDVTKAFYAAESDYMTAMKSYTI